MRFEYPLGLLGLIGIPILILIYIIKSHYTEQTISSTYIWELSEKFLKKRKPISKVSGIVSLILQICAVLFASLAIAHPTLIIPNSANEFCFVLDGSGSMNMINGKTTRFEMAKKEIKNLINDSISGSSYTLIYVEQTSQVIYEKLTDKDKAIELLNDLTASHTSTSCVDSLKYAQAYFNENTSIKTYLVTDKDFNTNNVSLINVSNHEANYAIADMNYKIDGSNLTVYGNLISYENDANLTVELYINDSMVLENQYSAVKLTNTEYSFTYDDIDFDSIKIKIKDSDNLALDNESIIYNVVKEHSYSTLLISDRPYYLQSILELIGDSNLTVVSSLEYDTAYDASIHPENYKGQEETLAKITGYGLYIFDSYNPKVLPKDGALWLFNITESIDNAGFTVQNEIDITNGGLLEYTNKKSTLYKTLTKDIMNNEIYINHYVQYGLNRNFTTILEYQNNPIVFAGTNGYGNRQVVFASDLHNANMAMEFDYLPLMKNFLNYSFPTILESSTYSCGDTLSINVISGCDSIRVVSPLGNISYLDVNNTIAECILTEVGTYKIVVMIGEEEKIFSIYSSLTEGEAYSDTQLSYIVQGEATNELSDGVYDTLIILFIILAVVYFADWMVYCYEQYQLR